MTPDNPENIAWAAIYTPLEVEALHTFCEDIERLYRINPYLEFKQSIRLDKNKFHFIGKNSSQEPAFYFDIELTLEPIDQGYLITYSNGVKSNTIVKIQTSDQPDPISKSRLTITDIYTTKNNQFSEKELKKVDKSLLTWTKDIQKYLLSWHKWSKFKLWRWYRKKIWLPMKPIGRRITYMLLLITLIEIVLIVFGAAIYYVEYV